MQVKINEKVVCDLSDIKKQVICNDIPSDIVDADLERRINHSVMHKYAQCMRRLRAEWMVKLAANGITMIPLDDDDFAQLVFSQPNYKDRKARDEESKIV